MSDGSDWEVKWNNFLASGAFDAIPQPENGYRLGRAVTPRDGIFYLFKGIRPVNMAVLALSRSDDSLEVVFPINDIRPNGDVMAALLAAGIVEIPEDRLIEIEPDEDSDEKNSNLN